MAEFFEDTNDDEQGATGGQLRAKLEETIKSNKEMQAKLSRYEVQEFLGGKSFDLVKPNDLDGVEASKWEAKASEVQSQRKELQNELLRNALAAKGLDESFVEEFVTSKDAESDEAQAIARVRATAQKGGEPTPKVNPEKLHGRDAILAAVSG